MSTDPETPAGVVFLPASQGVAVYVFDEATETLSSADPGDINADMLFLWFPGAPDTK